MVAPSPTPTCCRFLPIRLSRAAHVGQGGVYTQTGEIAETVFNMPATGAPNTGNPPLIPNPGNSPPGVAQATVCQKGSNGSFTPQNGVRPQPLGGQLGICYFSRLCAGQHCLVGKRRRSVLVLERAVLALPRARRL